MGGRGVPLARHTAQRATAKATTNNQQTRNVPSFIPTINLHPHHRSDNPLPRLRCLHGDTRHLPQTRAPDVPRGVFASQGSQTQPPASHVTLPGCDPCVRVHAAVRMRPVGVVLVRQLPDGQTIAARQNITARQTITGRLLAMAHVPRKTHSRPPPQARSTASPGSAPSASNSG